jgi:hypothetical protein
VFFSQPFVVVVVVLGRVGSGHVGSVRVGLCWVGSGQVGWSG